MNERTGRLLIQMKFQARAFLSAMRTVERRLQEAENGLPLDRVLEAMTNMAEAETKFDEAASELQGDLELTVDTNADPSDLTRNRE
jgi:hypothetical protein